jgi:hypothetical protein
VGPQQVQATPGTASYSIDLPNGGNADIQNNVIEQGPNTQNPNIIASGEEGQSNPGTSVLIANNVIVNDLPQWALHLPTAKGRDRSASDVAGERPGG